MFNKLSMQNWEENNEKVDEIKEQKGPCLWCDATDTCADLGCVFCDGLADDFVG